MSVIRTRRWCEMSKRFFIAIGSILALIVVGHFGELFINGLVIFLLAGVIMGTNVTLPSVIMLSGALLVILVVAGIIVYKTIVTRPSPPQAKTKSIASSRASFQKTNA